MVKDDGKWKVVPKQSLIGLDGWIPVCDKNLPFEATASFLLTADRPGIPQPIKLQAQHRELFPLDKEINEASGKSLAAWASGGTPSLTGSGSPSASAAGAPIQISDEQCANLIAILGEVPRGEERFKKQAKIERLSMLPATEYARAIKWAESARKS